MPFHVDEVGEQRIQGCHQHFGGSVAPSLAPWVTSAGKATDNALFEIGSLSEPRIDPLASLAGWRQFPQGDMPDKEGTGLLLLSQKQAFGSH